MAEDNQENEVKHIVIDARNVAGTTGRYTERLLHYLELLDTDNRYSVLVYPKDTNAWRPTNPNFTIVPCPHKEFSFDEQIGLRKQLQGLRPDLVHFTMVQQPVFYHGTVVTTMHDLITVRFRNPDKQPVVFWLKQQVYKWVNRRAAHKSALVIVPTEFVRSDVASFAHIDPAKITVTLEGADELPAGAEPVEKLKGKRFIMYIGRPTPHKNLGRLIDAFAKLQAADPDLHLVLAGRKDANYQRHEARVQAERIPNVVFTDFISDGQLRWLYEHCAAYVFPSLSEGFGLPGLEAMRHGAPVVSSNATCLPEVYGDTAVYFDPLDVDAIAEAIQRVLTDEKLRENLVKRGYEQVEKYSWERMARQTLEVYHQALGE